MYLIYLVFWNFKSVISLIYLTVCGKALNFFSLRQGTQPFCRELCLSENELIFKYELSAIELNTSFQIRTVRSDVTCLYETTKLWPSLLLTKFNKEIDWTSWFCVSQLEKFCKSLKSHSFYSKVAQNVNLAFLFCNPHHSSSLTMKPSSLEILPHRPPFPMTSACCPLSVVRGIETGSAWR